MPVYFGQFVHRKFSGFGEEAGVECLFGDPAIGNLLEAGTEKNKMILNTKRETAVA